MKQLVLCSALACAAWPAFAADEVVITASRFADPAARVPANVSIITREEIRSSTATDLPGLMKNRAGIMTRALYGNHGIDASVDLRGFGDAGTNNTLILLDGQRLNPVDGGSIAWSSIPLDQVERIEILRGAGTVLYGDRASGGVINIITDKLAKPRAFVEAAAGNFGHRTAKADFAGNSGALYYTLAAQHAESTGYRRNGQSDQDTLAGRVGARNANTDGFLDYAIYRDSTGLPGALFSQGYSSDPKGARFLFDNQRRAGYRLRPGGSFLVNDALTAEVDATVEHDALDGNFVSQGMTSRRTRDTVSLTPRLRARHGLWSLASETVFGLDFYHGDIRADYSTTTNQSARQQSEALYVQNTTSLTPQWLLSVGGRAQRMEQRAAQAAYVDPFMGAVPALAGDNDSIRRAAEIGLSYEGRGWRGFARSGTTFRFAGTDELFGYDPMTFLPVFAGSLRPQHGRLQEVGIQTRGAPFALRASLYRLRLVDEIGYDGNLFANTNFNPTERRGLELEAEWQASKTLSTRGAFSLSRAEFRDGAYAGNRLPLVPQRQVGAQVRWTPQAQHTYTLAANHTGRQLFSGDFDNIRGELGGYTTFDASAAWDLKPAVLTLRAANLTDKRYAGYAGYSTFSGDYFYYPADARTVTLSLRYDLR